MRISYLICSHRAPPSLDATLASLADEACVSDVEVVLVNNGFGPARERQLRDAADIGPKRLPLRLVHERRAGLGFARLCGFAAAQGEALVLLDDDNTVGAGFDRSLRACMEQYPNWGSICPVVCPIWEKADIPAWLEELGPLCLSFTHARPPVGPSDSREWTAANRRGALRAPGGGMIVRRDVVAAYRHSVATTTRARLARTGSDLGGCEDADLFGHVWETGRTAVFVPKLRVFHHIPASRCRLRYLLRLNLAMTRSYAVLDRLSGVVPRRRVMRHAFKAPLLDFAAGVSAACRHASISPMLVHGARAVGHWKGLFVRE